MKTRKLILFILLSIIMSISGCADNPSGGTQTDMPATEGKTVTNTPQLDRMKTICELATLECRYHNVAKSRKEAGSGLSHFGEKDRIFWIEYTGIAEISFKAEELEMEQNGTTITITLPEPRISCKVDSDSWTKDSYVISDDQWIQKNPITADDQTQAIHDAQVAMENNIINNSSLLDTAKQQARKLIENYINQIGEATGVNYTVNWKS